MNLSVPNQANYNQFKKSINIISSNSSELDNLITFIQRKNLASELQSILFILNRAEDSERSI